MQQPQSRDISGIMKPPVDTVRVSQRARDALITLKRRTGIDQWNILCRWAICASLKLPTKPVPLAPSPESTVEMEWKVFAGALCECLPALIIFRALRDGVCLNPESLANYFRNHLERGISLMQNIENLRDLLRISQEIQK